MRAKKMLIKGIAMGNPKKIIKKLGEILELSISLSKVNFKLRNEGSYLGIFWYLLDPLVMFLVILMLGGVITRTDMPNYQVYLLIGLITFNFFRQGTINGSTAISSNGNFIKSMKIPPESFVVSGTLLSAFSHFFEVIILIVFLIYFKLPIFFILFYPLIFIVLFLFVLGISFILAVIGAYINDLVNVWAVLLNLLWFATPIFYVISSGNISIINIINPMYYFVAAARQMVIYGKVPAADFWIYSVIFCAIFLASGILLFSKYKKRFAEVV